MSALILSPAPADIELSITTEALLRKDNALHESRMVVVVNSAESQEIAVGSLSVLKRFRKDLESSREAIKKPVLDLGRRIDAKAKEVALDVDKEIARIEGLVREFQREELARAERARVAAEKMARAKREREEAEARRLEEERLRLEREAADSEDAEEARMLAAKASAAAEMADEHAARAEQVIARTVAAPPKASGMSVQKVWKFRVTDVSALYGDRPDLCVLEASASRINAAIREGLRTCPGLEIYEDIATSVRAA